MKTLKINVKDNEISSDTSDFDQIEACALLLTLGIQLSKIVGLSKNELLAQVADLYDQEHKVNTTEVDHDEN